MTAGKYHWRDGWHFTRMEDGSVEVYVGEASTRGPVKVRAVIPADEWASIVAHVAVGGGTSSEYEHAKALHGSE